MDKKEYIDALISELNFARYAYYNEGKPFLSDKDYDDKLEQLDRLQKETNYSPENSPVGKVGAIPVEGRRDIVHEIRARSLDKTKDPQEVVHRLKVDGLDYEAVAMWKLDGCTLVLTYVDGDLKIAATRGDGEIGTDVLANTKYIDGIPQHINMNPGKIIVRGECLISYSDFERINANLPAGTEPYRNPRNLASASVSMLDPEDMKDRCLTFKAFDFSLVEGNPTFVNANSLASQFTYLDRNGFGVVPHLLTLTSTIPEAIKVFSNMVESYEYPVDGLVFALNDRTLTRDCPGTEHHPDPKYGYAFKWQDEEHETILREIEWSPSRTGLLNPVAIFDPVMIDGTTVTRASLHNLSYIRDKHLVVGDHITVFKANAVIPQIARNLSFKVGVDSSDIVDRLVTIDKAVPRTCPTCGGETAIQTSDNTAVVCCTNPSCPEKLIGNLVHFCSRDGLDIEGWSEETIKKLHAVHIINEFKDIFLLKDNPAMSFMPGFGKKSWMNLCQSAEKASKTTFVKFVSALSIPNVGKGQAKILKKFIDENYDVLSTRYHIEGYKPFTVFVEMGLQPFDFTVIKGIGVILSEDIITFMYDNFGCSKESPYKRLMKHITFIDLAPISKDFMNPPVNSNITGKSFCITGKLVHHANREELVAKIEAAGGKWVDSVSSKTNYLINNDVESTSGKNKKAQELNIPIISEEDFLKMLS